MHLKELERLHDWVLGEQRDLELQDFISPDLIDGDWRTTVRRARDLLAGHSGRLGIHGPFLGLTLLPVDPQVQELVVRRLLLGLEIGAELGATHMVIHSPFYFFGHPLVVHTSAHDLHGELKQAQATLAPILAMAERVGCMLVIETIRDLNPAPLLALVRSFDSDYLRLSIDTGHVQMGYMIGGLPPHQWVAEAGSLLSHVHLHDTDGLADRHWPPGQGAINWPALFWALRRLEQRPRLILELREPLKVPQAAAWFQQHGLAR